MCKQQSLGCFSFTVAFCTSCIPKTFLSLMGLAARKSGSVKTNWLDVSASARCKHEAGSSDSTGSKVHLVSHHAWTALQAAEQTNKIKRFTKGIFYRCFLASCIFLKRVNSGFRVFWSSSVTSISEEYDVQDATPSWKAN